MATNSPRGYEDVLGTTLVRHVAMVTSAERAAKAAPDYVTQRFGVFSVLLGLAVIFHQQQLDDWHVPSVGLLVTASAVWLILAPLSIVRLYVLMVLHITSVVIDLPSVVNHWLLLFIAEAGVAVAVLAGLLRGERWWSSPGALYVRMAPALRIQIVIVYVAASLAKLNSDFLDLDLSCGAAMVDQVLTFGPLGFRAPWLHGPAVYGAVAIEIVVAAGLAWRRTRHLAVFLGLGFHITLALAGHVPFSGFAIAFYSLFAPDDLVQRSREVLNRWKGMGALARAIMRSARGPVGYVCGISFLAIATLALNSPTVEPLFRQAFVLLFLVYAAGIVGWLLLCLVVNRPPIYHRGAFALSSWVWAVAPVLVMVNAASPYMGLKTQSTFTMYSNIQTEGHAWNHLLVSQRLQVFDVQDHQVRIIESSDPALSQAARHDRRWVWAALRGWAYRNSTASLTYEDQGVIYAVPRVGDDRRLRAGVVEAKLGQFRDVPQGAGNYCRTERRKAGDQHS